MRKSTLPQTLQTATDSFLPAPGGILQRKCASCSNHTIAGGECESCRKKPYEAAHVKDKNLQSSNHSFDDYQSLFGVPRFAHDFTRVRVSGGKPKYIQTKLTVNDSGDKYEREADQTADAVMSMTKAANQNSPLAVTPVQAAQVSRSCSDKDDETCASEMAANTGNEFLQTKEHPNETAQLNSAAESNIQALRGQGQSLSESERAFFEPRFGHDFSRVRVHTGGEAASAARSVNARAFTLGHHIVFDANEYAPETTAGKKLLAHELTHVLQQHQATGSAAMPNIQRDDKNKKKPAAKKKPDAKKTPAPKKPDENKDAKKEKPKAELDERFDTEEKAKAAAARLIKLGIEEVEVTPVSKRWIVKFRRLTKAEAKQKAVEKEKTLAAGRKAGTDYDAESASHYVITLLKCPEGVPAKKDFNVWIDCLEDAETKQKDFQQILKDTYGSVELYHPTDAVGTGVYYKPLSSQDIGKLQAAATKQLDSEKAQKPLTKCPDGYTDLGSFGKITTYFLTAENDPKFDQSPTTKDPRGLKGTFREEFLCSVSIQGSGITMSGEIIRVKSGGPGTKVCNPCKTQCVSLSSYEITTCPLVKNNKCAKIGQSVAVDADIIPLGSELIIEGVGNRIAEDVGGSIKGKHIDVYRGALSATEANKLTLNDKRVCKKK
jgi:3D (Asp-Asp-Asp) domain-containing protein